MQYNNFPGCINVEKTSEQRLQPLLLPENQKVVGKERKTRVRGYEVDKWTVGLNGGWLYNRVNPPEKRERDIKEKHWRRYTVALRRTPTENNQFV